MTDLLERLTAMLMCRHAFILTFALADVRTACICGKKIESGVIFSAQAGYPLNAPTSHFFAFEFECICL